MNNADNIKFSRVERTNIRDPPGSKRETDDRSLINIASTYTPIEVPL